MRDPGARAATWDDDDNAAGYDPDPDRDGDRYEHDLERRWDR